MSNLINYWQHIDVFIIPSPSIHFRDFNQHEIGGGGVCERAALPILLQMTEQIRKRRIMKR